MTRAEESANKAYGGVPQLRRAFINGYEQAEKDLALTADDVGYILNLIRKIQIKYISTVGCFPEVAEIFNETRKRD